MSTSDTRRFELAHDFAIVGLSHRTSEIRRLAALAPSSSQRATLARRLRSEGWDEVAVLATCNRFEVILSRAGSARADAALESVVDELGAAAACARGEFFALQGEAAMRHLLLVGASLDSLVVGERQITGQLRRAFAASDAVGPRLRGLAAEAFRVARRVRRETRLERSASVISLATDRIAARRGGDHTLPIALVGAGETIEHAALRLSKTGAAPRLFVNRTVSKARALAERFGGSAASLDEFLAAPPAVGALLTATAAPHAIFGDADLDRLNAARAGRGPLLVIDLAVPFDVDDRVRARADVELVTIETLRGEAARVAAGNALEVAKGHAVVERRLAQLRARQAGDERARALGRSRLDGEAAALRAVGGLVAGGAPVRLQRWAIEASHRLAHAAASGRETATLLSRERAALRALAPNDSHALDRVLAAILGAVAAPLAPFRARAIA